MFEELKNKNVKAVWNDLNENGQNKAVFGILKDISSGFILIIQNGNPVYLKIDSLVTLKEHIQNI